MDREELFRGLKGNDPLLLEALDEVKKEYSLKALYLIYIDEIEAVWGIRHAGGVDESALRARIACFLEAYLNDNYTSPDKNILLYSSDLDEVLYVARKSLVSDEQNRPREAEVLFADEEKGEVLLTVDFSFQRGVRNALTRLLPWVKNVVFSNDIVTITEVAARKIVAIMQKKNAYPNGAVRFKIAPGGCQGMQYETYAVTRAEENDEVVEKEISEGSMRMVARIVIDQRSAPFLQGSVIDWGEIEDRGLAEDFIIKNPNEKGSCGCGKSKQF